MFKYLLMLPLLTGCTSLQYAGVAHYTVKPFEIKEDVVCCEVILINGKEIDRIDVTVKKMGSDYTVTLKEWNVNAFEGQEIAADAATATASTVGKVTAGVLLAPTVVPAAGAVLQGIIK